MQMNFNSGKCKAMHLGKRILEKRPHLEYASVAWSARFKYSQDMIERVQRRATKVIPELKHLPYSSRLEILELPSLLFRRKRADVLQMYKFFHGFDHTL